MVKKLKIIVVLSIGIFFLGNINIAESLSNKEKIYNNIFIEEIDVSNLKKEEAKKKVENVINKSNVLNLEYEGKIYTLNLKEIGIVYYIDKSVEEAYNITRNKDKISNIKSKIDLKLGNKRIINLEYTYDDNKIDDYIKYIRSELNRESIDATIKVENKILTYTKEEYGIKIDDKKLREGILKNLKERDKLAIDIPVIEIKPVYLYEDLNKIDTILGTYETYFNSNTANRVNNIKIAAHATNDIIMKPYDEFSFNYYINHKDKREKFKKAPVIVNGKLEEGLGGGICQVSSTIYNAALYSGLEIISVRNHSIPSAYVSKGRDATVTKGNIDLKFRNNYKMPVFIHNEVYKDKIVSTIYGNKENKKEIEVVTEIMKSIPNKTKVEYSDKLYKGEHEISQKGRRGYKVNTFRVYNENGQSKKEFIGESYYPPIDEVITYGTKKRIVPEHIKTEVV